MKKSLKLLSLVLALIMALAVFAACDSGAGNNEETSENKTAETEGSTGNETVPDGESGSETDSATEVQVTIDIPKNNYNDDLFLLAYSTVENFWAEERDGKVVTEAVYDRQEKLYEHLGVTLTATVAPGNHEQYHIAFTTSIKNKDGAVDFFIPNAYMAVPGLIEAGYVRDLKTVEALNLDADYWNSDFMDSIALFDRYYLGYSDFNVPATYVIAFNKQMLDKYDDALNETVYDMVNNYHWTLDQMISLVNLVYIDKTGDGKTEDDTFGLSGQQWIPFIPFLHASNIKLVEQVESGAYEVAVMNEINGPKVSVLVDKLKAMAESDYVWLKYRIEDTPVISITTGRTLMQVTGTDALSGFLDYDIEFGILPYPMFDENQKNVGYISLNYDGYIMFPTYVRNETMIAESIEVLSYNSDNVRVAIFEKLLGKQVADAPDDKKMLDIVWNNLCSDFGLTYSTITSGLDKNLYMIPNLTHAFTSDQLASYVKSYDVASNKAIAKYLKKLEKLGS